MTDLGASHQLEWWNIADPPSEDWNIGKMGFGRLAYWVNGVIVLGIKLKMDNIL